MTNYRANVTRVTGDGVFFRVPDLGIGYEFGPSPTPPGIALAIDDPIIVATVSGAREDLVIVAGQGLGIALPPIEPGDIELGDLPPIDLNDLADVVLTSPATGALLMYDGADWVDGALAFDALTDVTLTSPAVGHVLQHNGTDWVNSATLDMVGASGADVITTKVTGDTQKRFIANAQGLLEWGSGSIAVDTNLYRSGVGVLGTDSSIALSDGTAQVNIGASGSTASFTAKRAASNSVILSGRVTTDTVNRVQVEAGGVISWGSGSASVDTNLYRSAANVLKTDDELVIVGDVTAAKGRFGGTSGDAVFIGNDGKLVDVGVTDAIGIQGQSNAANGVLVFGSGGDTNLYRSAANTLKTDDTFIAANIIAGDSGWTTPTLAGSWANFGGTHQTARYRKHPTGVVEIQGCVKSGSGTIFTLNSGYRPGSILIFACIGDNVEARVDVNPDGTVVLAVGSSGFLSINMSFYVG